MSKIISNALTILFIALVIGGFVWSVYALLFLTSIKAKIIASFFIFWILFVIVTHFIQAGFDK